RPPLANRAGAERMPDETAERCGLGALAADVAHVEEERAAPALEQVVEIAADLVPVPGGVVAGLELQAGDLGQAGWQQAPLQGAGDPASLFEQARVVDRDRSAVRELLGQSQVVGAVAPARLRDRERDRSDGAAPRDQRDGDRRAGVEPAEE